MCSWNLGLLWAHEGNIWTCSCPSIISPLRSQTDDHSDYFVPGGWLVGGIQVPGASSCGGSGPFPHPCGLSSVGLRCRRDKGCCALGAFLASPAGLPSLIITARVGIALVLSRRRCNNKYCFTAAWWMKSFNETGPNCTGKLPYFCVLNGSDPSATHSVSVPACLLGAPGPSSSRSSLPLCSSRPCPSVLLLLLAWPVEGWLSALTVPTSYR